MLPLKKELNAALPFHYGRHEASHPLTKPDFKQQHLIRQIKHHSKLSHVGLCNFGSKIIGAGVRIATYRKK